ncbi:MAG: ubiquitin [Candidatus Binatia bacterium]|nr:ubiquitin [Candidatus Binatia bacterium]
MRRARTKSIKEILVCLRILSLAPACVLFVMSRPTLAMQIFVRTIPGTTITLEVEPTDTIGFVKQLIQDRIGIPVSEQCLVFGGQELPDDATLQELNIQRENTLFLRECQRAEVSTVPVLTGVAGIALALLVLCVGAASLRQKSGQCRPPRFSS